MTQFRQESLATIRRRVGYLLFGNQFAYGALTDVGPNTASLLEAARYPNGTFTGKVAHFLDNGETLGISDSEQGTGELTLSPAFTVQPDPATYVEIWSDNIGPDEVNNAINAAIDESADLAPKRVSVSIADDCFAADRFSFTVPEDWVYISSVVWVTNSMPEKLLPVLNRGVLDVYCTHYQYAIEDHTLVLNKVIPAGVDTIYLTGYRAAPQLVADGDLCEVRSDYVMYKAASLLQMDELGTQANDPDVHTQRSTGWLGHAENIRARMKPRFDPNTLALE